MLEKYLIEIADAGPASRLELRRLGLEGNWPKAAVPERLLSGLSKTASSNGLVAFTMNTPRTDPWLSTYHVCPWIEEGGACGRPFAFWVAHFPSGAVRGPGKLPE